MRVAIITGGIRGLGLATARALGSAGWHVLLTYRTDTETAASVVASLASAGISGECLQLDAASPAAAEQLSANPRVASASRLAVIHNAAAAFLPMPVHLTTWEQFEVQLGVGLHGLVSLAKAAVPRMVRTGGGVIVVVLSRAVLGPPPKGFAPYVAAKQAMRSLVKSLAIEHGARGVRVLSVCPGFMVSSLTSAWSPALQQAAQREGATPTQEAGAEIARLLGAAERGEIPGAGEEYPV
jgi:NAD(P)-dependent dehydrogenase (short-subunit alcohol dehydrogenase family)